MFPTPIQKYSIPVNILYRVALIVTLFIWLMPLIAVMLTSIRTYDDILAGNYWGWPKAIAAIPCTPPSDKIVSAPHIFIA